MSFWTRSRYNYDMPPFQQKYSKRVRLAIEKAYNDDYIRPVTHIHAYCEAGELRDIEGEKIPKFEIPYATVIQIGKREERRRRGMNRTALSKLDPDDAIDQLRQRLVSVLDNETMRLERRQKVRKNGNEPVDAKQVLALGRALRELRALPKKGEPARKPGQQTNGEVAPEGAGATENMATQIAAAMAPKGLPEPLKPSDNCLCTHSINRHRPDPAGGRAECGLCDCEQFRRAAETVPQTLNASDVTPESLEVGNGDVVIEIDDGINAQLRENGSDGDPGSFARDSLRQIPNTTVYNASGE